MSSEIASPSERTGASLFATLSGMMFVLFFVWGAWFAGLGRFMGEAGMGASIGKAYACTPIAAIVTPFFIGMIADRFMNAEKLQGILLMVGGIFIGIAPSFAKPETATIFLSLLLAHALCFMPTLSLSNTICLKHLADSERDYPRVRIFATLGWIVAGLAISFVFKFDASANQCYVAAGAAFLVGAYSFFLPKTPPPARGEKVSFGDLIGADCLPYFRKIPFAVFMFGSFLVCIAFMPYWANLGFYLGQAGIEKTSAFQTWGQVAELPVLFFVLPFFIKRFGIKWTLLLGIGCWIARYFLLSFSAGQLGGGATGPDDVMALLLIAILLHGFSYDFVFVSGYLYVDSHVDEKVRAQAQGLLNVFTQGIAFFISSNLFAGYYYSKYVIDTENSYPGWQKFWMLPVGYLIIIMLFIAIFFKDKPDTAEPDTTEAAA